MFGKHIPYKGFVYKICKELFVYKKTNNPIENWVKFLAKHFTKEDIWVLWFMGSQRVGHN